jgi:hypothetical protein
VSFYTGTQTELLYTLPAAVTKNTFTAQAVVSAPTATAPVAVIPAGYFMNPPASGPGKAVYVKAWGTIANTAAATLSTGFTASITGLQGQLSYALELLGTWSASSASNTTTLNQMFLVGLN